MINLLPENEKAAIHKEYRLRVFVVMAAFSLTIIAVCILFLAPTYILAVYHERAAEQKISAIGKNESAEHKALDEKLKNLKVVASVLAPEAAEKMPTDIIGLLLKYKMPDNTVTAITIEKDAKSGTVRFDVKGVAKTRQSLVSFTGGLEKETAVANVDLPIGNLSKDSNIQYSFSVSLK